MSPHVQPQHAILRMTAQSLGIVLHTGPTQAAQIWWNWINDPASQAGQLRTVAPFCQGDDLSSRNPLSSCFFKLHHYRTSSNESRGKKFSRFERCTSTECQKWRLVWSTWEGLWMKGMDNKPLIVLSHLKLEFEFLRFFFTFFFSYRRFFYHFFTIIPFSFVWVVGFFFEGIKFWWAASEKEKRSSS